MLDSLTNSFSAVFVLLALTSVGFVLGHMGWMNGEVKKFLSKFIVNVCVPCTCLNGLLKNLSHDDVMSAGMMSVSAFLGVLFALLTGYIVSKFLHLPRNRAGVFVAMCGLSNTVFIGLPVSTELFGSQCVPYVMLYYMGNSLLLQTVGIGLVQHAGEKEGEKFDPVKSLKQMFTRPPVLSILLGITLLVLDVQLPHVVMSVTGYFSSCVAPMALLYCGYVIYEFGLRNLRLEKSLVVMMCMRFLVAPVICMVFCQLFGITGLARSVFVVESALPVVSQIPVFCGAYGADEHYAATGMALSTIACFVVIPVLMLVL